MTATVFRGTARVPTPRRPADDPEPTVPVTAPPPQPAPAPDAALVARAQAGDAQAFGAIYDRYFDTVWQFVSGRVNDRQAAETLTGDVWLHALRNLDRFTGRDADFGAWILAVAGQHRELAS